MMIRKVENEQEVMQFINAIQWETALSHPMFTTKEKIESNLLKVLKSSTDFVLGVYDEDKLIGFFSFMYDEAEKYMELMLDFSKESRAYKEIFDYLQEKYPGYQLDCVFSPNNNIIKEVLEARGAEFYKEQLKMKLKELIPFEHELMIIPYASAYEEGYKSMHSTDVYWLAERVIKAENVFKIFLALENNEVVGYIDVTHKFEENEPFDLLVKEEYRNKGYGKALLQAAVIANHPKAMSLLVDYDNAQAISAYHHLGFIDIPEENNITAHLEL